MIPDAISTAHWTPTQEPIRGRGSIEVGGQLVQIAQKNAVPIQVFQDVPLTHPYFDYIGLLPSERNHIRVYPTTYCPDGTATRGQMAVFIIRALLGAIFKFPPRQPVFTNVPAAHPYFKYIQKLRQLGIPSGCTATTYCPDDPATRGKVAVFIVRARLGLMARDSFAFPPTPYFTDVPATHPYFSFIQEMRALGITSGCSPTTYCPNDPNTRGQMSVFIIRGLLTP
jgi:S-layer homology domain